jgi:hypothetical protein
MRRRVTLLTIFMLLMAIFSVHAKSRKTSEMRFQFGLGVYTNTNNILGLVENARMAESVESGSTYSFPGITPAQSSAFQTLDANLQRAVYISNILGGMEYGIKARVLWGLLIAEADVSLVPLNGSYNGRFDLGINTGVGIRAPFWIQPYATVGPMFTFSWYPDDVSTIEPWKTAYAAVNNFAFRPGLQSRLGLDFKFKRFSIGAYYQYQVKDFQEFTDWYGEIYNSLGSIENAKARAAGMVVAAQSRIGASLVWYIN